MKKYATTIMTGIICCLIFTAAQTTWAQILPKDQKIPNIKSELKAIINFDNINDLDVFNNGFLAPCSDIFITLYRVDKIKNTTAFKYIKLSENKAVGPSKGAKNGECNVTFTLSPKSNYTVSAKYSQPFKSFFGSSKPTFGLTLGKPTVVAIDLVLAKP